MPLTSTLTVINPHSGDGDDARTRQAVRRWQIRHGGRVSVVHFKDLQGWREQLVAHDFDAILAAGGDGTVNLVAQRMLDMQCDIPLGILPCGSANGLAVDLGYDSDLTKALDQLHRATPTPFDVIEFEGHGISLHLADLGLNAHVVRHFESVDTRGMGTYVTGALKALGNQPETTYHIRLDSGRQLEWCGQMLLFANARMYGTGATVNPGGDPTDGQFELCLIKKVNLLNMAKLSVRAFWGDIRESNHYKRVKCRHAEVRVEPPQCFQMDGELCGSVEHISAHLRAGALRLLLPERCSL